MSIRKQSISLIYTTAGLKSEFCSSSFINRVSHIVLLKLEPKISPRKPRQQSAWKILTLAVSTNLNYTQKILYQQCLSTSLNTMILIHDLKKECMKVSLYICISGVMFMPIYTLKIRRSKHWKKRTEASMIQHQIAIISVTITPKIKDTI